MAVEYHATDFHIMESRLELAGRVTQVRRAVKENVVGNSRLDFASILPAPAHLPVDVPDMKPYAGYAARLFLQDFLCGKGLDTKAMLREEREYLDRHKEVKAGPYLRGKELFLQGFRNVTEEDFYCFLNHSPAHIDSQNLRGSLFCGKLTMPPVTASQIENCFPLSPWKQGL